MNRARSVGVDTIPPEAQLHPAAIWVLTSSGGRADTSYPCRYGAGSAEPTGRLVADRWAGPSTTDCSTSAYDRPVAAWTMSAAAMLSEFEYLYCVPGANSSVGSSMNPSSFRGGG